MNLEEIKKEGYIDALTKTIERKCESVMQSAKSPAGLSPSDLDRCESKLKECLIVTAELKKLQ